MSYLSGFETFASGRHRWADIPLSGLASIQAVFTLGMGIYLASGRGKSGSMVVIPGRGRRIALAAIALVGTAAIVWGFTEGSEALVTIALWPNMVGLWILLQFRTIAERFQHKEQWTGMDGRGLVPQGRRPIHEIRYRRPFPDRRNRRRNPHQ